MRLPSHRRSSESWNLGCQPGPKALNQDAAHSLTNWVPAFAGTTAVGIAILSAAVSGLLIADPWLCRSLGFALSAAAIHEYRGGVVIPVAGGGTVRTQGAAVFGTVLDMRLGSAHIFWHNRNAMGKVYEGVPGFLMPRLVQLYGVRWAFWN